MIHEEICTYDVCKLAKDKGFPQEFDYAHFKSKWNYYNHKGELNGDVGDILKLRLKHEPIPEEMKPIAAPTQSLLQRWLREEKGIDIVVMPIRPKGYSFFICSPIPEDDGECMDREDSLTYELALEDALKYALEKFI